VGRRTGHTLRWVVVWASVVLWFVALALDVGGNWAHLMLLAALAVLIYELLVVESV
jgi:hypothetical protein